MQIPKRNSMKEKAKNLGKVKNPKVTNPEKEIQAFAEQLLAMYDVPFVRVPDSILKGFFCSQSIPIWTKRHVKEYLSGLPDLILFNPDKGTYKAIEIKTEKGRLSAHQERWKKKLNTTVTMGWEATKHEIMEFINAKE